MIVRFDVEVTGPVTLPSEETERWARERLALATKKITTDRGFVTIFKTDELAPDLSGGVAEVAQESIHGDTGDRQEDGKNTGPTEGGAVPAPAGSGDEAKAPTEAVGREAEPRGGSTDPTPGATGG